MTKQRRAILEALRSTTSHPTADWVYERVRKAIPDISLGTVYRNLKLLRDQGEILELNYGSTFSRFDGNPRNHYHFQCEKCGRVLDVRIPIRCQLESEVAAAMEVEVHSHRMEFYGLCDACKVGTRPAAAHTTDAASRR